LKTEKNGRVAQTVDRADKWLAQTPQMFRIGLLLQALEQAGALVTDEASAIELMGHSPSVHLSAYGRRLDGPGLLSKVQVLVTARAGV
jgi:2-C-methyl-D-erythritol 4-phosphate cytidylyltransferase